MEEKKNIFQNKKLLIILPVLLLIVAVIGITYAFFNYTRTGTANTIRVGRISFNTTQASGQDGQITLTNVFPITRTAAASDTDNSGEVVITITGDTDYSGGVEYLVTATGVTNTVGGKNVPIGIIVTPSAGLGTASGTYYTARNSAESHIYKVEAGDTIEDNGRLLVGYIVPNSTPGTASGINGTLTIKAFIDKDKVAITDTYNGEETDNMGTTTEWVAGRTVLTTTEWNSLISSGISFKVKVEANEGIWVKQIPVMSLNSASGTVSPSGSKTSTITTTGDGTVSCQSGNTSIATCSVSGSTLTINGVGSGSTTITVNQAEGTNYTGGSTTYNVTVEWPIASCQGCKFTYATNSYYYTANNNNSSPISTLTTFENNNETLVDDYTTLNKNYFLGFKFDETTHEITHAYACGIKGTDNNENVNQGTAFCVEGSTDGSTFTANKGLITGTALWNDPDFTAGRCSGGGSYVACPGSVGANASSNGYVRVDYGDGFCYVSVNGSAGCGFW